MNIIATDPRDDFEKVFPLPKHVIRCGNGYACTEYNAWGAYEFIHKWEGWRAAKLGDGSTAAPAVQADQLSGNNEQVSQPYTLPEHSPCADAPDHIWLQTAGEWPASGEFSELTWSCDNQHPDDTLYVRADLVGNSPAIPDAIDANLVEAFRLVQCMLEDYRERNYGDAEQWIRHINDLMSDYSEAHGDDAYSVLHGLLPAAPKQEAE